jgi:Family of unknown function (DUF6544)
MIWLAIAVGLVAICIVSLLGWRLSDVRHEQAVWMDLLRRSGAAGPPFDPATIEGLPEPARRYFGYTIAPGTPLVSVIEIDMAGQLGLGDKADPNYGAMRAEQILAPPLGFVWRVRRGMLSGSDGMTPETSWTKFWLSNLIPIVRVSGNPDHHRSAFGRVVSEGAFWAPATLLPSERVVWSAVDEHTARATVAYGRFTQAIDLRIEADGRPSRVVIQRWSNANADKVFREQPFGGDLSDFRLIAGYRLPMRVEGGNLIGADNYFPFFKAQVESIVFPQLAERSASDLQGGHS